MTAPPIPPVNAAHVQQIQDAEHLRLLSVFYYVMAGILGVTGLIFIVHIIMGLAIVGGSFGASPTVSISPNTFPGAPPFPSGSGPSPGQMPNSFGWIFVFMGAFALVVSELMAALSFFAGRCLAKQQKKTFVQVVAGLLCLHVPLGTALGVFTFIVLARPSVAPLFPTSRS